MNVLEFKQHSFYYNDKAINLKVAAKLRHKASSSAKIVLKRILNERYPCPALPPLSFMDHHQMEGLKWILTRKRSYLAHSAGAGKTLTTIAASVIAPSHGQVVFIVPPNLMLNWEREIKLWTKKLKQSAVSTISMIDRPVAAFEKDPWSAHYIIVPDSRLTSPDVYTNLKNIKIKFLAVDEASRFKDPEAKRSQILYGGRLGNEVISGLYCRSPYVVFLDGSPMPNRPIEIWTPTYRLSPHTIDYMDRHDFGLKYCGARMNDRGQWEYKWSSNEAELKERLQKDFMHVVGEEKLNHPERMRSLLFMTEDPRTPQMKAWEQKHITPKFLSDVSEISSQGEMATMRQELGILKVPWAAQYIRERLKNKNESLLVFAWHRSVIEALTEELEEFSPGVVMGGTSDVDREQAIKRFQAGKCKLLIGNILSLGRGHNITRADRAIFVECSWGDETNKQAEKRASRKGRDTSSPVRCEYLVVAHSFDEKILSSVFNKQRTIRKVIGI